MGYVNDTGMVEIIPANQMAFSVGTWTDGVAANQWSKDKAAAAETTVIRIPVLAPQNSALLKGSLIKSIDIWWVATVAAFTTLTPVIQKLGLPADNVAWPAVTQPAFTYDAANDTNAKRVTAQPHKMTLTITAPFWLDDDEIAYVELTAVCPAGTVMKMREARINYTLRS